MTRGAKAALLTLAVAAVGAAGPQARGGAPADAKYLGSKLCQACHQGTHAALVKGWAASPHARAMWKLEDADATHKVVADFTQSPPFPKDKVAYVLGSGQQEQAYLDADLKVLPGVWKVKEATWAPQAAADAKTDCLGCHTSGYDPATAKWTELGVGCEMCHGPGSAHATGDKKTTLTNPKTLDPARQAMVCGRCHSVGKDKDGVHPFSTTYHPGDDLDQSFTLTKEVAKGQRNAQYNELRLGGGKHLAAGVTCVSCHDPHGSQPDQLKQATVNETCLTCHAGKLHGPQHSEAALKAVSCALCHLPSDSHAFLKPHGG